MEDKSIFELIAEYSAGTISPADAELLRERLESDAEAMRLFREIRETEKVLKSVQVQEKIDLQKSWQRLDSSLAGLPRKGRRLFLTVGSVVAASVALLLMFLFLFLNHFFLCSRFHHHNVTLNLKRVRLIFKNSFQSCF